MTKPIHHDVRFLMRAAGYTQEAATAVLGATGGDLERAVLSSSDGGRKTIARTGRHVRSYKLDIVASICPSDDDGTRTSAEADVGTLVQLTRCTRERAAQVLEVTEGDVGLAEQLLLKHNIEAEPKRDGESDIEFLVRTTRLLPEAAKRILESFGGDVERVYRSLKGMTNDTGAAFGIAKADLPPNVVRALQEAANGGGGDISDDDGTRTSAEADVDFLVRTTDLTREGARIALGSCGGDVERVRHGFRVLATQLKIPYASENRYAMTNDTGPATFSVIAEAEAKDDVQLLMEWANVSHSVAARALEKVDGDVVEAMMDLGGEPAGGVLGLD